jgi:hypothetical protein
MQAIKPSVSNSTSLMSAMIRKTFLILFSRYTKTVFFFSSFCSCVPLRLLLHLLALFLMWFEFVGAAVSSIVYLRNIFPESCFRDGEMCGVTVRTLDPQCEEEAARLFTSYIEEGLMSAVADNLLLSCDLLISNKLQVLEKYTFAFSDSGLIIGASEPIKQRDPKKSVQIMLRKLLITTDALGPLEDESYLSIRLHYKSDIAEEFEPKWFQTGGGELQFADDEIQPMDLNLGGIDTADKQLQLTFQARPEQILQDTGDNNSSSASTPPTSERRKRQKA